MMEIFHCLTCKRPTEHDTSTQFVTCTLCGRVHERKTEHGVLRDVHADGETRREDEQIPGPSARGRTSAVEEQFLADVKHLITEWLCSPRHLVLGKPCPELLPPVMHLYLLIREREMLERRRLRDVRRDQERTWREMMIAQGSNPDELEPLSLFRNIKEGVNPATRNVPYQVLISIKLAVQEEYLIVLYSRLQEPGGDEPETKPGFLARRSRLTSLPKLPTVPDLYDRASSTEIKGFEPINSDKYLTIQHNRLSNVLSRLLDPVDRLMINVLGLVQHLEHTISLPAENRIEGVKNAKDRSQLAKSFDAMEDLDFDAVLRSAYNLYRALQCVYLWPRGRSRGLAVAVLICALHIEIGHTFPESKALVAQLSVHIGGAGITESHACIAAIKRFIIAWSTSIPDANLVFEIPDVEAEAARSAARKQRGEPAEQPGDQPILKTAPFPQIRHPEGKDTGDGYAGWAGDWRRGIPPNEMFRLGGRVVIDHWRDIMEARLRTRDAAMDYQEEEDMARELFSQFGYHPERHRRRPAGTATPSRRQTGLFSSTQALHTRPSSASGKRAVRPALPSPSTSVSSVWSDAGRFPAVQQPNVKTSSSGTSVIFDALSSPPATSEPASPPISPQAKKPTGSNQASGSNFWRPSGQDPLKEVKEMLASRDDSSDEDVGPDDESADEGFADDHAATGQGKLIGLGLTLADKKARLRQNMIEADRASPMPSVYHRTQPSHRPVSSHNRDATGVHSRRSRHSSVTSNASSSVSQSPSNSSNGGTASPASTAARSLVSDVSATISLRSIGSVLASEGPTSFKVTKWRLFKGLPSRKHAMDLPQNRHIGVLVRERDQYLAKWQLAASRQTRDASGPDEIDDGLEAICLHWVEQQREAGAIPDEIDSMYLRSIGLDAEHPMRVDLGSWVEDNLHKWSPIQSLLRAGIQPRQIPEQFMPHSETALWLDLYEYRTPLYFRLLQGVNLDPGQDLDGEKALKQLFEVGPERLGDFLNSPSEVKRLKAYHEANKTFEGMDFDEDGFLPSQRAKHQRAIEKAAKQARDKEMRRRREALEAELERAERSEDDDHDDWMLNQTRSSQKSEDNEAGAVNEQEVYRQFAGEFDGIALNRAILGEALGEDAADLLGEHRVNESGGSSPNPKPVTSAFCDIPAPDDGESSDDESGSSNNARTRAQVSELRKVAMEGRKAREAKLQAIKDQERAAASALRAKRRAEIVEAQRLEALQKAAARRSVEEASARERAQVNAENAEYWRQQEKKKRLQAAKRAKKAEVKRSQDPTADPAQPQAGADLPPPCQVVDERNTAADVAAKLVQKAKEDYARARAATEETLKREVEDAQRAHAAAALVDLPKARRLTSPQAGQKRKSPDHPDHHPRSNKRPLPGAPPLSSSSARVETPASNKRLAPCGVAVTATGLAPARPVAIPISSLLN